MKRRDFISLLGGAAAAWPLAARAQQPAVPVIGYIEVGSPEQGKYLLDAFRKGLSEAGYVEGRNVTIEPRWAYGEVDRLPALASDLVQRRVALIATPASGPAALAAKAATATIPIVFSGSDPVKAGLVDHLNRPGDNLTGYSDMNNDVGAKRLGLFHTLLPPAARFGILIAAANPSQELQARELTVAAAGIGRPIETLAAGTDSEIDAAFGALAQRHIDALLVNPSSLFFAHRQQLITLAARYAVPAMYWDRVLTEGGGLISYGTSIAEGGRQIGIYAGRILKGENPAELPVQQATKIELVINLKTAKALGFTVPDMLLTLADEVIEP
jgi:putative ABC transport system substrate-binding protein